MQTVAELFTIISSMDFVQTVSFTTCNLFGITNHTVST